MTRAFMINLIEERRLFEISDTRNTTVLAGNGQRPPRDGAIQYEEMLTLELSDYQTLIHASRYARWLDRRATPGDVARDCSALRQLLERQGDDHRCGGQAIR